MAHKVWHHHGQMSEAFRTVMFLPASGGLQDAYTYIGRGKRALCETLKTGNIVLMSQAAFDGDLARVLHYLCACCSPLRWAWRRPRPSTSATARPSACTGGSWCWWWRFCCSSASGSSPTRWIWPPTRWCPFACAMQAAGLPQGALGYPFASTMCIGNMRSGMESLVVYFHLHDRKVLHKALHYFGVILLFAVGAGAGCPRP